MKTIAAIIALFFCLNAKSQIKVKVIDATGIERWIDYVPGVTTVTGTTKAQLDSMNTSLRSYLTGSLNSFTTWANNTFALKGTTGTPTGKLVYQNLNGNFLELYPANYNPSLKQGKFSMNVGEAKDVNGIGGRSNVVLNFASYNDNGGGGPEIPGEASYRFAGETNFNLDSGNPSFEFHLPDVFTNAGVNIRPMSNYFRKASGYNNWDLQTNAMNFAYPEAKGGRAWGSFRLQGNNTTLEMMSLGVGNSELIMHGYSGGVHNEFKITAFGDNGVHFNSPTGFQFHQNISFSDYDAAIIGGSSGSRILSLANGGRLNLIGSNSTSLPGSVQILSDRYKGGKVFIGSHFAGGSIQNNLTVSEAGISTGGGFLKFDVDVSGNLLVTKDGVTRTYKPQ